MVCCPTPMAPPPRPTRLPPTANRQLPPPGTYYSYVYARCLAAHIWASMLQDDPLDPEAGND